MGRFIVKRDELTGLPRALTEAVASARAILDIFPAPGVGVFAAGIGLGCGLGWPLRQAYGPPRAFCGPGVGVGVVAAGYGQGIVGIRFGRDRRAPRTREHIASVEGWIIARCDAAGAQVSRFVRRVGAGVRPQPPPPPPRKRRWFERGGQRGGSAFVHAGSTSLEPIFYRHSCAASTLISSLVAPRG